MAKKFESRLSRLTVSEFYEKCRMRRNMYDFRSFKKEEKKWMPGQKALWIDTIFRGMPSGQLILRARVDKDNQLVYDVIDGRERLKAIVEFVDGGFPLDEGLAEKTFPGWVIKGPAYYPALGEHGVEPEDYANFWKYDMDTILVYNESDDAVQDMLARLGVS